MQFHVQTPTFAGFHPLKHPNVAPIYPNLLISMLCVIGVGHISVQIPNNAHSQGYSAQKAELGAPKRSEIPHFLWFATTKTP